MDVKWNIAGQMDCSQMEHCRSERSRRDIGEKYCGRAYRSLLP